MKTMRYLTLVCAFLTGLANAEEVVEQKPGGLINWSSGVISAYGYGVAPDDVPLVKQRLLKNYYFLEVQFKKLVL